ncbi:MAG: sulfatase-like hydrolase/transferase, partial [Actinomycetota bacterium]|nr:sulfatase-like hydrolase/transferase [Actinomycetota bacterium]
MAVCAGALAGPGYFGPGPAAAAVIDPVAPDPATPVVMVILDELPTATLLDSRQMIDVRRFPNFARLARSSTWYRDNASAGDYTAWAVPPILTGNRSNDAILPTSDAQPNNIFNLLGPGRRVHVREEVTELCPARICPVGNQGEAPGHVLSSEFIKAKFGPLDLPAVSRWIDSLPSGRRTLSVLHLPLPHQPQRFLPGGQIYPGGPLGFTIPPINGWTISNPGITLVQQRHILQTAYTDRIVGRILNKVKSNGDWDRSLVIVTADHGYSFDRRYDRRDVSPQTVAATVNPPLFVKYPGQNAGVVSPKSTQGVDLVPTIAETLGVTYMYETDGVPIREVPEAREMVVDKDNMKSLVINTGQIRGQRPALVATSHRRLGDLGLWSLGPRKRLIGTRPGRKPRLGRARVKIDHLERLQNYRPGTGQVPSLVSGVVTGVKANEMIALAINGKVTGTTRTFAYNGAMRFGSMVPPAGLRRGSNRPTVYLVRHNGTLHRIR